MHVKTFTPSFIKGTSHKQINIKPDIYNQTNHMITTNGFFKPKAEKHVYSMANGKHIPMVYVQYLRTLNDKNRLINDVHRMLILSVCRRLTDRSACCDQFIIGTPLGHEFIMCVLLYDRSIRHHCYDVSSLDSRQPVSDDDAGSSFSCLI